MKTIYLWNIDSLQQKSKYALYFKLFYNIVYKNNNI